MKAVNIVVTHFEEIRLETDLIHSLKDDGRTKEDKLKNRYLKAVNELSDIAYRLGVTVADITPNTEAN